MSPAYAEQGGPIETTAQPERAVPGESAAAKFALAREHFQLDEYGAALPLFLEAYEETASPNAALYVARCNLRAGSLAEAYDWYDRTIVEASSRADEEPRYAETRDAARAELDVLANRVARVVVLVSSEAPPRALSVNGRSIDTERVGLPIPVEPGDAVVRVEFDDCDPVEQTVPLRAGQNRTVVLSPPPKEVPKPVVRETQPRRSAPRVKSDDSVKGTLRVAGYVSVSIGGAALGTALITGILTKSRHDSLERNCGGSSCDPIFQADVDSGRTLQTLTNVSLGVGIVGIVGGGTLIALGWPSSDDQSDGAPGGDGAQGPLVSGARSDGSDVAGSRDQASKAQLGMSLLPGGGVVQFLGTF